MDDDRITVAQAAERWLAYYVPTTRSVKNVSMAAQRVRDYVQPYFGDRALRELLIEKGADLRAVTAREGAETTSVEGLPVIGTFDSLPALIRQHGIEVLRHDRADMLIADDPAAIDEEAFRYGLDTPSARHLAEVAPFGGCVEKNLVGQALAHVHPLRGIVARYQTLAQINLHMALLNQPRAHAARAKPLAVEDVFQRASGSGLHGA